MTHLHRFNRDFAQIFGEPDTAHPLQTHLDTLDQVLQRAQAMVAECPPPAAATQGASA